MKSVLSGVLLVLTVGTAWAGADCQEHPESEWMTPLEIQKRIVNEYGFSIKLFKVDGDCYEIYGWETDAEGNEVKIEVYFDTRTGDIVKKELD